MHSVANRELLEFYGGRGTDDRGRRIEDIWAFSNDELESVHDYIQWLFPLADRSTFNPRAPLLDAETIDRFRSDPTLSKNVDRSLRVMLDFYGLAIAGTEILRVPTFGGRSKNWLRPNNHNFLRLTRILKSLTLLGYDERARQLLECLIGIDAKVPGVIGGTTLQYWRDAVGTSS
jgi:hypothetical protein